MTYDPNWIPANLEDMAEFCRVNSMPETATALEAAIRTSWLEIDRASASRPRTEKIDLAEALDHQ